MVRFVYIVVLIAVASLSYCKYYYLRIIRLAWIILSFFNFFFLKLKLFEFLTNEEKY